MAAARGLLAFAVLLSSCIALAVAQSAPVPLASLPGCGSANAPLAAPLASGLDNCVISGLVGANGTVGWGFTIAEATAGGVPLSEVRLDTMESRLCPGLHFAGEVLDVDGRIGGFNFQWAWASGFLAGTAAAS